MKIDEATYKAMPVELQALFRKMPNPSSDEVVGLFPVTTSGGGNGVRSELPNTCMSGKNYARVTTDGQPPSSGSAARFFYTAKASKRDRDEGCEGLEERGKVFNGQSAHSAGLAPGSVEDKFTTAPARNFHPTVKPTDLMRYLCRLVTPPGGVVLDPFMGSGSTGKGAILEGFNFIGIEQNAEYIEIAKARIAFARTQVEQEPAKVGNPQTSLFNADE
jgi:site-specific DNA-methyltransferase (adenine-specific)